MNKAAIVTVASIAAVISGSGGMAASVLTAPIAGAATSCGLYQLPAALASSNPGSFALVVTSGQIDCSQARAILADQAAGKGTPILRNSAAVDGYTCVGNPGGTYSETGVLSYCEAGGVRFEVQKQ